MNDFKITINKRTYDLKNANTICMEEIYAKLAKVRRCTRKRRR